jgi:hypothetical protein
MLRRKVSQGSPLHQIPIISIKLILHW